MPEPLWTAAEIASATGGELIGSDGWTVEAVHIDSREIEPGAPALFVALQGERDGHEFLPQAYAMGAAAALVSKRGAAPEGRSAVLVEDTQAALEALGAFARDRARGCRRIGVTGSAGKTTTRELIKTALRAALAAEGVEETALERLVHASVKSFNNHIGVPLTLARLHGAARLAVFEMGMNARGEIAALTRQVRPHIAVITSIGEAHLGGPGLGTVRDIAEAKSEIFEGLEPGGAAVIPGDGPHADLLLERAAARAAPEWIVRVDAAAAQPYEAIQPAPGEHWRRNAATALFAAGAGLGSPSDAALEAMSKAIARFEPEAGRGGVVVVSLPDGPFTLIDESYNANPSSMRAALASARERVGAPVAVLGDMLELGLDEAALHAGLADDLFKAEDERVFLCGPLMRSLRDELRRRGCGPDRVVWAPDSEALAPLVAQAMRPGDVVMVKGSNGSKMKRVVEALKALGANG